MHKHELATQLEAGVSASLAKNRHVWMVYGPRHGKPFKMHFSECDALIEAKRLARKHEGDLFLVIRVEVAVKYGLKIDGVDLPF